MLGSVLVKRRVFFTLKLEIAARRPSLLTQGKRFGVLATVLRSNKCVYIQVLQLSGYTYFRHKCGHLCPMPKVSSVRDSGFRSWSSVLFFPSGRRSHGERENLQTVYKKATRCREAQDPPGQWAQVHVDVPASAHLLLPLQRVHLVRTLVGDKSLLSARCLPGPRNGRTCISSLSTGVCLESRVTSARVSGSCRILMHIEPHIK